MPKSSLDWLAVVGLWIGGIVLAFKAWNAPLMPGAPDIFAANFWNFVPAVLVTFAFGAFIYRQFFPIAASVSHSIAPAEPLVTAPQPAPLQAQPADKPVKALKPPKTNKRVYVSAGLTPDKLMAMCKDKTTHQAKRIVEPYLGKWMRVEGVVRDYSQYSDDLAAVAVETNGFASIRFYFNDDFERLEMLEVGETITVDGKIKEIDSLAFHLKECEIVSVSS